MSRSSASVGRVLVSLAPIALFFLLFAGVGIVHVTSRVLVVDAGYRLSQLQSERARLEAQHRALTLERHTLRNHQRLSRLAEQMGMARPAPTAILTVPAAPAAPAAAAGTRSASRSAP
jgi:cell division protein FtsL